jgi:hypothetical protein
MLVAKVSPISGTVNERELPITLEQVEAWRDGAFIQDVMPHLTPGEREFLISGVTEEEWDAVFGGEE